MMIDLPKTKLDERREMKFKVPMSMHVKLYSIRVLQGKKIHEVIEEALDHYFATREGRAEAEDRPLGRW